MTIFDDLLNIIPGASLVQAAIQGRPVTPSDFIPGSRIATTGFITVVGGGKASGGTASGGLISTAVGTPLTTSGSRTSPVDNIGYVEPQQDDNNMMMYAGAVVGIVIIGGVTYAILKKKN
jgi:hypothetical protein